jgi:hypothetical protein
MKQIFSIIILPLPPSKPNILLSTLFSNTLSKGQTKIFTYVKQRVKFPISFNLYRRLDGRRGSVAG